MNTSHRKIYRAAKNKFGVTEGFISGEDDSFVLTANDGRVFTETDFTDAELAQAESDLKLEKAQAEAEAQAKRQALLDKLGITEEEARLLLGGN